MAFDQQLRDYLESIGTAKPEGRHRRIDEHALRRHFLERLRELESERSADQVAQVFASWSSRLQGFARYIEALSPADAPVVDDESHAYACRLIDVVVGRPDPGSPRVDALELSRIASGFQSRGENESYALENQLVRRLSSGAIAVTGLGRAFLRLRGRDAVRWLLTVEVALSRGSKDQFRASREMLEQAASSSGVVLDLDDRVNQFSMETLVRLEWFDVFHCDTEFGVGLVYRVADSMRAVVQSVLDAGPWHTAVAALLDDERGVAPGSRATDAVIDQTRLITHEVRNALIPVRHHLEAMLKSSREPQHARLATSHRGVLRVLAFIDEMVATSELVSEPATSFELGEVLREALGWQDGGERVEVEIPPEAMRLRAPRSRVLRAVSNVVLNALQATEGRQRVRIQILRSSGLIEVAVDDAGPGVPEELRTMVFRDGFTTRSGGSGFGLAFARRVIEELQGRVWCERSALGGARFVMAFPDGETQP